MLLQRPGNERFKDISLEFSNTTSVDFTLSDGQVWEEIRLDDANVETNYVNISAINVYNKINNGFSELKVFGGKTICSSGIQGQSKILIVLLHMADNYIFQFVFNIEFLLQKRRPLQFQQQLLYQVVIALYVLKKLFL